MTPWKPRGASPEKCKDCFKVLSAIVEETAMAFRHEPFGLSCKGKKHNCVVLSINQDISLVIHKLGKHLFECATNYLKDID